MAHPAAQGTGGVRTYRPRATSADRERVMAWWGAMVEAAEQMSPEDRAELDAWEDRYRGQMSGRHWPGWGRFLDLDKWPWPDPRPGEAEPRVAPPERPSCPEAGHHVVYFVWSDDDLLYVGVSSNLKNRARHHRLRFGDDVEITWDEYPSRAEADTAEHVAITTLCPSANRIK